MNEMRFGWIENTSDLAAQRSITRAELKRVITQQIIAHVQCIYHHEQMAYALYQTLAEKRRKRGDARRHLVLLQTLRNLKR